MKTKDYTVNDLLPGTAWLLTLMGGVLMFVLMYGAALCTFSLLGVFCSHALYAEIRYFWRF